MLCVHLSSHYEVKRALQFGASSSGPLATATVSNMVGFAGATTIDSWGVVTVPGGYVFRNDTSNDLFQALNFGSTLYFDLTFAGDADPTGGFVSVFTVAVLDSAYNPLGAADPARGALASFYWTPSLTPQGNGIVSVNIADSDVSLTSPVLEPTRLLLMLSGLVLLGAVGWGAAPRPRDRQDYVPIVTMLNDFRG